MKLSEFFGAQLRDMDQEYESDFSGPGDAAELREWRDLLLSSLEGFTTKQRGLLTDVLQKNAPQFLDELLDETFVRDALARAQKMVSRAMRLASIVPEKTPSVAVNAYLREATRCFIYGFNSASVALCRAALEQAIREALLAKTGTLPPIIELSEALRQSLIWKALSPEQLEMADQVRRAANRVMHQEPSDEGEAWETLSCARGVLTFIYKEKIAGRTGIKHV